MTDCLIIRSIDRIDTQGNASHFRVALFKVESGTYAVTEVSLSNMSYNINTSNNSLTYTDTATHTITIPVGYYTTMSLATAISSAMSVASGVIYTGSVDPDSTLITLTGPGAFTLKFATLPGRYIQTAPFATLGTILGYGNTDIISIGTGTTPGTWTATGVYPPNLNWNSAYYISIDTRHSNNSRSVCARQDNRSCTLPVLIDVPSNTTIVYRPHSLVTVQLQHTKEITVSVKDDTGFLAHPLNGQLTLILERVR